MIERLEDWPWSSYRSMVGEANAPDWLDADGLLSQFGRERKSAIESYRRFVKDGRGLPSPLDQTRHQWLLGDDAFVERYRQDKKPEELREVSKAHRRSIALPLDDYRQRYPDRNEAMARAYLSGAYTLSEICICQPWPRTICRHWNLAISGCVLIWHG